eukprot:SAG22_NODE_1211_length_5159_cov_105.112253_1_plen_84_part_00
MKLSKLKKHAAKAGVPGGLVHEAATDDDDPFGILFQLVTTKVTNSGWVADSPAAGRPSRLPLPPPPHSKLSGSASAAAPPDRS